MNDETAERARNAGSGKWLRARFQAQEGDYRPIKWPPPGPYWCTGSGDGYSIIVAYVRNRRQINEFWPEAVDIDIEECEAIHYSDRFQRPDWYSPNVKVSEGSGQ